MTRRPRLLDLFACEGGAGTGYHRAGFDVVGVDLLPKFAKRYPFEFHAADALEYVKEHGHEFDAIHASPPCQAYSHATVAGHAHKHPDLVGVTRDALIATGKPFIIENVPRAPLISPITLCGTHFGLRATDTDGTELFLQRHRLFESNAVLTAPRCDHPRGVQWAGVYGGGRSDKWEARHVRRGGYVPRDRRVQEELLGIDWMTQYGRFQSVPPIYTEFLGRQLLEQLGTSSSSTSHPS